MYVFINVILYIYYLYCVFFDGLLFFRFMKVVKIVVKIMLVGWYNFYYNNCYKYFYSLCDY